MFSVAAADAFKKKGQRGSYLQTHNTYTQVSSEVGIPGLLLYGAALWQAISSVRFVRKNGARINPDLVRMGNCLHASWILFLGTGMFASVAYHMPVAFLLGFSYVLKHVMTSRPAGPPGKTPAVPALRFATAPPVFR